MNVYKLKYASKESLDNALLSRGVLELNEEGDLIYAQGTHAVVYLGNIELEPAVLDSEGNEVSPAVISDKYHADIMVESSFNFKANDVGDTENPYHTFNL